MQVIAGAPNATLPIEETLETLAGAHAGYVEVSHRKRGSAVELEVTGLPGVPNGCQERLALESEFDNPIMIGDTGRQRFTLVVTDHNGRAF